MNADYEERLSALARQGGTAIMSGGRRGIEKESLRVDPAGLVARTPHPATLGSALTNRFITTDYSEALLEFVTAPENSCWSVTQFMCDIHQFVYPRIGDEMLWPLSMPCRLRSDDDIPLAQYGTSNVGRMKTVYREGLGNRYGRYMQAISGIHFNYSVPDAFWPAWADIVGKAPGEALKSDYYLGVVRNVRRLDWLILYLFGASPALCKSFLKGVDGQLEQLDSGTCYGPHATSLRMSDLGYQNTNQSALVVSANSLDEYIRGLSAAIVTPNPDFVKIGVKVGDHYRQLNANQLQIENEYYSTIRPKRVARSGERPTAALQRGGIEYVELRALDLSPFDPIGISQEQQKFLEAFLLYCLVEASPPIDEAEQLGIQANHLAIARRGREPGVKLHRGGTMVARDDWATEELDAMRPICELLDEGPEQGYVAALEPALAAVRDPDMTSSARVLAELRETQASFADWGLDLALRYKEYFLGLADDFNRHRDMLAQEASDSLEQQRQIEAGDRIGFDEYLTHYYD